MPSGKSKSKEQTWTEEDLTRAIQSEKAGRSKKDRKESKDDQAEKRHTREKTAEDWEKDRRHQKSERHQEELEYEEHQSKRTKDGQERKHKDRNREGCDEDDESNNRKKEKRRKKQHGEDEYDRRRLGEGSSQGKEKLKYDDNGSSVRKTERGKKERKRLDEGSSPGNEKLEDSDNKSSDRKKERRRKHDDDGKSPDERNSRAKERQTEVENGSSDRKKERRRRERKDEDDGYRTRQGGESSQSKDKHRKSRGNDIVTSGEKKDERQRKESDRKKDDRRLKEDDESSKRQSKYERRQSKDERKRESGHYREMMEDDMKEHHRERSKENKSDRIRNKQKQDDGKERKPKRDEEGDEKERRRKQEKTGEERRENENESKDKDRRRKDEYKRSKDKDNEDKQRRREERKTRKEHDQEGNKRSYGERKESTHEVREKEPAGKLESEGRLLSMSSATVVVEEIQNEDEYGEDNYEDDFEDYEDDFEDEDEVDEEETEHEQDKGKLLEIFEAINAENDDVRRPPIQQARNDDSREEIEKPVSKSLASPQGRINFFAAKQKHVSDVVASKTRKRAEELRNLVEFDVASFDIFDLPPLSEYELYIKSYGQSDCKQAYVQCHDDLIEREMQTEMIETCAKWTQFPPEDFRGCGEGDSSQEELQDNDFSRHSVDTIRLTDFLQRAGQVCLILLEESVSARKDLTFKERNDTHISDGFIQLAGKLDFLEGRRVLDMKFNSVQTHLLLTAHDCGESNKNDCLQGRGIVCQWNVNEPSQPQKILYCESSPYSCCFSPVKSSLVFAGLEDGSVVLWDIRESSSLHSTLYSKDKQWIIRRPTFSSAGVLFNENHLSPVESIIPIALPMDSAQALSVSSVLQDEAGGKAFQLASLDESGAVNIWVVIELDKPDEAGSERDLGLAPGGRVKLIRSTSIQVESPNREIFVGSSMQTSVMQFSTLDPNHFYVGTDRGWVVHCTRYGGKTHPKVYRPQTECFVSVSAIDVSPWNIPVMLVGSQDGVLRLHDLRKEHVIRSWSESTQGSAIVQVMWSKSRPALFFVLDDKSNLYTWDLLQSDGCPIVTESLKRGKLLSFSLSNDYESLGIGLPGRKSEMVLSYEGSKVELHRLKENLTNVQADELDRFASFVDSII